MKNNRIEFCLNEEASISFNRRLESANGIFLANENSMINTEQIDGIDGGFVGPQSVDLGKMTGNPRVVSFLENMLRNSKGSFFPGTLLNDFGGYVLPVMPIILEGEMVGQSVRQSGIELIDDYKVLAKNLGMNEEEVENSIREKGENLYRDLREQVRKETNIVRKNSLRSFNVGDYRILPVICNDLSLMPNLYEGEKVNCILHACNNYSRNFGQRVVSYETVLRKMKEKGLVEEPVLIGTSDLGNDGDCESFVGSMVFENDKLVSTI